MIGLMGDTFGRKVRGKHMDFACIAICSDVSAFSDFFSMNTSGDHYLETKRTKKIEEEKKRERERG